MISLRGVKYGCIKAASGTLNFFKQGWPFHRVYKKLIKNFNFDGCAFTAKTSPVDPRFPVNPGDAGKGYGNMVIKLSTQMPVNFLPDCIAADFFKGRTWNAVGLTTPGLKYLLQRGIWQEIAEPFFISVMCVGKTEEEKNDEMKRTVKLFRPQLSNFQADFALELNESCPNAGCDLKAIKGAHTRLEILSELGRPILIKTDVATSIEVYKSLAGYVDGFILPNTLKFGLFPEFVDWESHRYHPGVKRMLRKYGTCGYAGPENTYLAAARVLQMREAGIDNTIVLGGLRNPAHVWMAKKVGADGGEFGSAAIVRPWNIQPIIQEAHRAWGGRDEDDNH